MRSNKNLVSEMRPTFALLLVSLMLLCPTSSALTTTRGVVVPTHATLLIGEKLRVSCTVYDGEAADLVFRLNNVAQLEYTQVVNSSTIELKIDNVTEDHGGSYFCWHNQSDEVGQIQVNVVHPPVPVTEIRCKSPSFKYMICDWCPEVRDDMTAYNLTFTTEAGTRNISCSLYVDRCSCVFCRSSNIERYPECGDAKQQFFGIAANTYNLVLTSSNYLMADITLETVVDPYRIVVAGVVDELDWVTVNETMFGVQWQKPYDLKHKINDWIFRINVTSRWDSVQSFNVTDMRFFYADAHPGTLYSITVEAKPASSIYWGDVAAIQDKTRDAAPSAGPVPLNFWSKDSTNCKVKEDCRRITVFWKDIPEFSKNGEILDHTIYARSREGEVMATVVGDVFNTGIDSLKRSTAYNISVTARTSGGNSPVGVLLIEQEDSLPPTPDVLAEWTSLSEETISLTWTDNGQSDQMVIFTCQGDGYCKEDADEIWLPMKMESYVLPSENAVVGISSVKDNVKSGMAPQWLCIYRYDGDVIKPDFSLRGEDKSVHVELHENCDNRYSRPQSHRLKSCQGKSNCETEDVVVFNTSKYTISPVPRGELVTVSIQAVGRSVEYPSDWVKRSIETPGDGDWLLGVIFGVLGLLVTLVTLVCVIIARNKKWLKKKYGPPSISPPSMVDRIKEWREQAMPDEYDAVSSDPGSADMNKSSIKRVRDQSYVDSGQGQSTGIQSGVTETSQIPDYAVIGGGELESSAPESASGYTEPHSSGPTGTSQEGSHGSVTSNYAYKIEHEDPNQSGMSYPSAGSSSQPFGSSSESGSSACSGTTTISEISLPLLPLRKKPAEPTGGLHAGFETGEPKETAFTQLPKAPPLKIIIPAHLIQKRQDSTETSGSLDMGIGGSAEMQTSDPIDGSSGVPNKTSAPHQTFDSHVGHDNVTFC